MPHNLITPIIQCLDYAERGAGRTFEHELAKQADVAAAEQRAMMDTLLTDTNARCSRIS